MIKKYILTLCCGLFIIKACELNYSSKKKNILLICIDDLRPELKSFGASYIYSPNIDSLAAMGMRFNRHFVNAPSCGPSRYTLLTGTYGPSGNNALFLRANKIKAGQEKINPSLPEWFKAHGYTTVSVGKVSHHPGGRGGKDWNDSTQVEMPGAWDKSLLPVGEWQHPRGVMHGLANGEIRKSANEMDVFQHFDGDDESYPDGAITNETQNQINQLAKAKNPFLLAVGIIKPHLPFGAPKAYYDRYNNVSLPPIKYPNKPTGTTTWHNSGEFMKYKRWGKDPNNDKVFADEVRRHYAAAVSYADAQVGKILETLKKSGAYKNTIIVLWGDHGWHLGEHGIWGKHSLFEESLQSPLIIYDPFMNQSGRETEAIVETLDLFPTLCDLTDIDIPSFVNGVSLKNILKNPHQTGHAAIAYTNRATTIRTDTHRMILHKDGQVELYDHSSPYKETRNIFNQNQGLVLELKEKLEIKLNQLKK